MMLQLTAYNYICLTLFYLRMLWKILFFAYGFLDLYMLISISYSCISCNGTLRCWDHITGLRLVYQFYTFKSSQVTANRSAHILSCFQTVLVATVNISNSKFNDCYQVSLWKLCQHNFGQYIYVAIGMQIIKHYANIIDQSPACHTSFIM